MSYLTNLIIGFCIMNAMPHLLFGVMQIRFISPFGYTSANQLTWSAVNIAIALLLFHREYGIHTLYKNGIVMGAFVVLISFAVSGRFFYNLFNSGISLP